MAVVRCLCFIPLTHPSQVTHLSQCIYLSQIQPIPEQIRLQERIGDVPDDHVFSHQDLGDDGKIFRSRGHNDADISDHVEVDAVFGLVDTDAFESGGEIASDGANGENPKGNLRSKPCKRLNPCQSTQRDRDTVEAEALQIRL